MGEWMHIGEWSTSRTGRFTPGGSSERKKRNKKEEEQEAEEDDKDERLRI
jgi:hypothetical protein